MVLTYICAFFFCSARARPLILKVDFQEEDAIIEQQDEIRELINIVLADITAMRADFTTANEDKIRAIAEVKRIETLMTNANDALKEVLA